MFALMRSPPSVFWVAVMGDQGSVEVGFGPPD
jgi:hypothetical protein